MACGLWHLLRHFCSSSCRKSIISSQSQHLSLLYSFTHIAACGTAHLSTASSMRGTHHRRKKRRRMMSCEPVSLHFETLATLISGLLGKAACLLLSSMFQASSFTHHLLLLCACLFLVEQEQEQELIMRTFAWHRGAAWQHSSLCFCTRAFHVIILFSYKTNIDTCIKKKKEKKIFYSLAFFIWQLYI